MKNCYDPSAWKLSRMEFRTELNLFSSKCINLIGSSTCECRETFMPDTKSETYACIPRAPYAVHQMTHYDSKIMQFSNTTLSTNDTFVTNETQSFKLKGQGEENRSIYADLCMTSLDKGSLEINFYTMAQVGFNIEQAPTRCSLVVIQSNLLKTIKVAYWGGNYQKSEFNYSTED